MSNYVRIDFDNCSDGYDYTICNWSDVEDYLSSFKNDYEDLDEVGFLDWKSKGYLPKVTLSIVQMTDEEYSIWFKENIEKTA